MLFLFLDQGKKSLSENKCTACISGQLSLDSLSAGQVLGFSANPLTTDNFDTKKHLPNPSTNTSNY